MSETDSEREFVEKVKQQHVRFNTDFLVKELKVAGEKTARDRVFFVSAREALLVRESRAKGKGLEGEGAERSHGDMHCCNGNPESKYGLCHLLL